MKVFRKKIMTIFCSALCILLIIGSMPLCAAASDVKEAAPVFTFDSENDSFSGRWSYKKLLKTVTTDYTDPAAFFADMATATKGTFFLYSDCTLPADAVVPSGVTFLLPYNSSDDSGYAKGSASTAINRMSWTQESTYLYHTLTIPEGKTLTVNGTVTVGGVYGYPDQSSQAHTSGAYSQIICNGNLTVNDELNVYGLVKGSGTVTVKNGAEMSLPFLVNDFDGGTNSKTLYDAGIFPFNEVAMNNMQARCVMEYGCKVIGKARIYFHTLESFTDTNVTVLGTNDGIIHMQSGSTVTTTYNPNKKINATIGGTNLNDFGKLSVTVSGNANAGSTSLNYLVYTFDSANFVFGLPYNIDLTIESGTFNVPHQFRIMPGSCVTVASGATMNVTGQLQIVDGWEQLPMTSKRYPTSAQMKSNGFSQSGTLTVNGTMNVNSGATFVGAVQTTEPGNAVININSGAVLSGTFSSGTENSTVSYSLAAKLNLEGTTTNMTAGTSYYGYSQTTWTVPSYTMNVNGTQTTITTNQSMNGQFSLHKYSMTNITEPTCTQEGNTGDLYCTVCNQIISHGNAIPALGHSTGDSSFTWSRASINEEWNVSASKSCSRCGEVFSAQSVSVVKTAESEYTATATYADGSVATGVHTVPVLIPSDNSDSQVNNENGFVYGLSAGLTDINGKVAASDSECTVLCVPSSDRIGTGSVIKIYNGDVLENEYTVVIFGDVDGDGWYDSADSIIVSCLKEGLLSQAQLGPAAYFAADCNHDGAIDELDVSTLDMAGLLIVSVDQSKSGEEIILDSAFEEYLSLIDQNVEIQNTSVTEEETAENQNIQETQSHNQGLFSRILEYIIMILNAIKGIFKAV